MIAYIAARYGDKTLAAFQLLCSFESFRVSAENNTLNSCLAMPLLSFEKYLREIHSVEIRHVGGRFELLVRGRSAGSYEDDIFSSVTGFLVHKLRELYPEADDLQSSPVVQVTRGRDVHDMLAGIDLANLSAAFGRAGYGEADLANYNDLYAAYNTGTASAVKRYQLVDEIYELLVAARADCAMIEDEMLPFHEPAEFFDVATGALEGRSLKWYGNAGKINAMIAAQFKEMHPSAVLSEDGKEMRVGGGTQSLVSELGLVPTPAFLRELTLDYFVSMSNLERPYEAPPPAAAAAPVALPRAVQQAPVNGLEIADAGVQHVQEWGGKNHNALSREENIICFFGCEAARLAFSRVSEPSLKRKLAAIAVGEYDPSDLLQRVVAVLKTLLPYGHGLADAQLSRLAGGVLMKRKGCFEFGPRWTRKLGAI